MSVDCYNTEEEIGRLGRALTALGSGRAGASVR